MRTQPLVPSRIARSPGSAGMGLNGQDLARETDGAMSKPETAHALMRASTLIEFLGIEPQEPRPTAADNAPEQQISRTRSIRQAIAQTASISALNNTADGHSDQNRR